MARPGRAGHGVAGSENERTEKMAIEKVSPSDLVEDAGVYPRGMVSEVHVADLAYALDAGAQLPVPVIDRETQKIVDGFHRVRAHRKRLGENGVIDADV